MKIAILAVVLAGGFAGGVAFADEHHHSQAATVVNPTFDKMKGLIGNWEGSGEDSGKKFPATTGFKMVSGNSVLMNTLGEGTPHEMITMIHLDGKELMATHYCAAANQPRLRVTAAGQPNQVTFEFKDGTNIAPGEGHMQRVIYTFVDGDHHTEDWVYADKGKESTGHFDFHRKK